MARPLVFLKTEWMEFYDGRKGDKAPGKFEYVKRTGHAHEDLNFRQQGRYCYGYAPINRAGGSSRIRLEKHFGADPTEEYVDHVDVVFIASAPDRRGVVVVGWYLDARLYAELHTYRRGRMCRARVDARRARRLPIDKRSFRIDKPPRRANIWYASERPDLITKVRRLMAGGRPEQQPAPRKKIDTAKKLLIEKRAYEAVTARFAADGFTVEPVWRDRVGWDLEARRAGITLRIEVKGTEQNEVRAELTPNEYTCSDHESYRICIVTGALTQPVVHTFAGNFKGAWYDEEGERELLFDEQIAARLSVRKAHI